MIIFWISKIHLLKNNYVLSLNLHFELNMLKRITSGNDMLSEKEIATNNISYQCMIWYHKIQQQEWW